MSEWSLPQLFASLHGKITEELRVARVSLSHPGTKGDASEQVWIGLLQTYLPKRYQVGSAHIVDSEGQFSDQIDVVIYDRQYSPFIFDFMGATVLPAESVYAVFEAKQAANAKHIDYAQSKIQTVRCLKRTSLPIPSANGVLDPKEPHHILGGLLAFESDWTPSFGQPLANALHKRSTLDERIDLGCVTASGFYYLNEGNGEYEFILTETATTAFLFKLIGGLQSMATVPMVDVDAYAKWLDI